MTHEELAEMIRELLVDAPGERSRVLNAALEQREKSILEESGQKAGMDAFETWVREHLRVMGEEGFDEEKTLQRISELLLAELEQTTEKLSGAEKNTSAVLESRSISKLRDDRIRTQVRASLARIDQESRP